MFYLIQGLPYADEYNMVENILYLPV